MAVTRIKSNQISTGAVEAAALADFTITGGKLANALTYGSDLTVSGNLTVNGTTTTVDTVNTTIDDPILLVGSNQTGAGAVDLGILGERGDDTNVFVGYDESADEFVTALVSDAESSTTVTITDYADMHVGGLTADDAITATGNVTGGNLITSAAVESATVTATGAVTGGSLTDGSATLSSGSLTGATNVTASGTVTGGTLTDGTASLASGSLTSAVNVTASGTVTGGTVTDGTASLASGSLTSAVNVTASGTVTGGTLTDGTASLASGALSGATTGAFSGNVDAGNLVTSGKFDNGTLEIENGDISTGNTTRIRSNGGMGDSQITATNNAIYLQNDGGDVEFRSGAISGAGVNYLSIGKGTGNIVEFDTPTDGGIELNTYFTATGNITGGNLITAGDTSTATLQASGATTLGGTLAVTGNATVANFEVNASSTLEFNENTLGNIGTPVATGDAATKGYVDNLLSSGFTISDSEDTPNTQTIAQGDTLTIAGTANEVTAIVSATDTLTLGLPDDVEITNDLTVGGNLIVQGSQTIVDSTSSSIVDPILQLGRGANNAALTANDGKDRGISMYYYDGSEKVAFFGFDDPSDEFRFIPEATISSEAVTGSLGTANLGKVRVDNIDIDGNTLEATSGNLTIQAAGTDKIVLPTGNELVITDMGDTGVLYSNSGEVSADATNFYWDGTEMYAANIYSGGYLNVDGTANVANLEVAGGAAIDGAITSVTNVTASGTVTGATITDGTASLASGSLTSAVNVTASGTVTGGTLTDGTASLASGSLTSAVNGTFSGTVTGGTLTDGTASINAGAVTGVTTLTASGNVTGGNLITSAAVESATVTATGAVTGGSVTDGTATLSSGALSGATTVTASGNVTGGNLITSAAVESATVTATGTVTGGTLTDGTMSVNAGAVTGVTSLAVDNITVDGDDITTSGSALTINDAGADVDFRVEGSTNANMLVVDAGADAVMVGTATATTDASFKIGTTDSMMVPVGTTAQRPGTGVGGMLRYNSTTDQYEGYDVSEGQFKGLGVPAFTVIASETFDGDGSATAFTLSDEQTTASCIVAINGVVQLPTTAYSVSGNAMTFTEAPETGDKIEVRKITTTTTVTGLSNADASVVLELTDDAATIKGNLVPTADDTYDLGSSSAGFATIYGKATSAEYADLAEKYEADADYEPGTVVHFGGDKEVTECDQDHCSKVAGVVSTAPAYRMNDGLEAEHTAMVALTGRVPCKVTGPVAKGDMMVSAGNGMARAESEPKVGTVIGKALENHEGGEGVIEVVVGKH